MLNKKQMVINHWIKIICFSKMKLMIFGKVRIYESYE